MTIRHIEGYEQIKYKRIYHQATPRDDLPQVFVFLMVLAITIGLLV